MKEVSVKLSLMILLVVISSCSIHLNTTSVEKTNEQITQLTKSVETLTHEVHEIQKKYNEKTQSQNESNMNENNTTKIQKTNIENTEKHQKKPDTPAKPSKTYFPIPELGIKILVDGEIKDDLIYKYDEKDTSVVLSLKSIIAIDELCSTDHAPLGALIRLPNHKEYERWKKMYQNKEFTIYYQGPQAPCSPRAIEMPAKFRKGFLECTDCIKAID